MEKNIIPILKVVYERPPNFALIVARFGRNCQKKGVMFTYGDTVYYPGGAGDKLSKGLHAHEGVHSYRQGQHPDQWWDDYLHDKNFRLQEELIAHQVEYIIETQFNTGRTFRRRYLAAIAERLSGPLYGRMCTRASAKRLITGVVHEARTKETDNVATAL